MNVGDSSQAMAGKHDLQSPAGTQLNRQGALERVKRGWSGNVACLYLGAPHHLSTRDKAIGLAPTTCAFLAEHAPRPSHLLQQHSDSCCSAAGSFSCAVSSCFQQILRICTPATSEQQCSDCKAVRSLCQSSVTFLATPCASAALCSLAFAGIGPSLRSRQRHDR